VCMTCAYLSDVLLMSFMHRIIALFSGCYSLTDLNTSAWSTVFALDV